MINQKDIKYNAKINRLDSVKFGTLLSFPKVQFKLHVYFCQPPWLQTHNLKHYPLSLIGSV